MNKTNAPLSSQTTKHKKRPWHTAFEILATTGTQMWEA